MKPRGWIFRFERLINPAAFSLFFPEGRCLCGITAGNQVVIREFETEREARESIVHLMAELERNEHENISAQNNPAA